MICNFKQNIHKLYLFCHASSVTIFQVLSMSVTKYCHQSIREGLQISQSPILWEGLKMWLIFMTFSIKGGGWESRGPLRFFLFLFKEHLKSLPVYQTRYLNCMI